jgi:nucleotide-binding universal stress UspA family protein
VRSRSAPASRTDAERLLAGATGWLRQHHPAVPMTGRLVLGDPVDVLADLSANAQLLVVGHGGAGLASLGVGAVAGQLSRRSRAPLIVRTFRPAAEAPAADAPVLVAVAAEPSGRTLRFAFAEAARYGVPLVPCHVGPAEDHERARVALDAALPQWAARYPDVTVRFRARAGTDVARSLAQVAARARLLVVGAGPGRSLAELLRGSVASRVLRAATCPVAIVPDAVRAGHHTDRRAGLAAAG